MPNLFQEMQNLISIFYPSATLKWQSHLKFYPLKKASVGHQQPWYSRIHLILPKYYGFSVWNLSKIANIV